MPAFTTKVLIEKAEALTRLAYPEKGTMDIYTAAKLEDFLDQAKKKLASVEKYRTELQDKHKLVGEDGKITSTPEADAEWDEFMNGEVVLPNVKPIPLAKFEKLGLGPIDLTHLKFLLVVEEEPKE